MCLKVLRVILMCGSIVVVKMVGVFVVCFGCRIDLWLLWGESSMVVFEIDDIV